MDIEILGSSSDHTVVDAKKSNLIVGDEVTFNLNYSALLAIMTSPYVYKKYSNAIQSFPALNPLLTSSVR